MKVKLAIENSAAALVGSLLDNYPDIQDTSWLRSKDIG